MDDHSDALPLYPYIDQIMQQHRAIDAGRIGPKSGNVRRFP